MSIALASLEKRAYARHQGAYIYFALLKTLDFAFHIGSTPTFNTAYAAYKLRI